MDRQVAAVLEDLPAVLTRVVLPLPDDLLSRLGVENGVDASLVRNSPGR